MRDGRALGFAEYGRSSGKALFYFHGYPGSRVEARPLSETAERFGIRLIAVDRPGMGLSTFLKGRRLIDWPADVGELADRLEIERFSVIGCSGGGPYALACARKIPERLISCGIVAGAGIFGPAISLLSRSLPWFLSPLIRPLFRNKEEAAKAIAKVACLLPEPDRRVLPRIGEAWAASLAEAFRQGWKGPAYEGSLLGGDWGFKAEDVRYANAHWWHGELDRHIPVTMGRALAKELCGCQAIYYPDEGHISLIVNHGDEIVETLVRRL
ncbi:MAG TPA: alpha/beta hydrolase [Methylovirgula sp.]|nr:alpha/beta hydrolase [Methylovirgula sp.]